MLKQDVDFSRSFQHQHPSTISNIIDQVVPIFHHEANALIQVQSEYPQFKGASRHCDIRRLIADIIQTRCRNERSKEKDTSGSVNASAGRPQDKGSQQTALWEINAQWLQQSTWIRCVFRICGDFLCSRARSLPEFNCLFIHTMSCICPFHSV